MNDQNSQGHPAYKVILDTLPPEFHPAVIAELTKMDQSAQKKLQDVRDEYKGLDEFKPFIESNIDAQYAQQAVQLAHNLQNDPKGTVEQINEAWKLGYVTADQIPDPDPNDPGEDYGDMGDISKNPQFIAMQQALDEVRGNLTEREKQEQSEAEADQFEEFLDELEEKYKDQGGIDRTFVTAYMVQGVSADDAVKAYQGLLGKQVADTTATLDNSQQPPNFVAMDGNGSGSGTPENPVNFGAMKPGQVSDSVAEILRQAQQENNQQG